ncbi:hypothetical protein [Streptomyces lasalocidi]|uniref:hypothetical protein n=1 Tax=Streptomyces lasalocidi TaxID=324833 RepID=UPI003BAADB9D
MTSEGAVVHEAVRAAWDSYRILDKRTPQEERRRAQQRVQAALDTYGRDEVSRGAVFLVGVLTAHIIGQQDDGEEDQLDPFSDLIPAVVCKLPGFEPADPAQVPMVAGVLTAAAMGMDTVVWRDRFGAISPEEALVHNLVLELLADLFDTLVEEIGATDLLMRDTFDFMMGGVAVSVDVNEAAAPHVGLDGQGMGRRPQPGRHPLTAPAVPDGHAADLGGAPRPRGRRRGA